MQASPSTDLPHPSVFLDALAIQQWSAQSSHTLFPSFLEVSSPCQAFRGAKCVFFFKVSIQTSVVIISLPFWPLFRTPFSPCQSGPAYARTLVALRSFSGRNAFTTVRSDLIRLTSTSAATTFEDFIHVDFMNGSQSSIKWTGLSSHKAQCPSKGI